MEWFIIMAFNYLSVIPGVLFAVENWRIWYWNHFKRGDESAAKYYPFIGSLFLFIFLNTTLPGLWAYAALVLDYACLPMCAHWCYSRLRHRSS